MKVIHKAEAREAEAYSGQTQAGLSILAHMDDETRDPATLISFFDLAQKHCRWPVRGEGLGILYCGETRLSGKAYCEPHCKRAWSGR